MNGSALMRAMPWNDPTTRVGRWWSVAGGLRGVMIGALPIVLEVVSPQRVALSVAIAALYLVTALVIARPRAIDRPVIIYAAVALAFIAISLLKAQFIDPLNAAQRSYGFSKAFFFIAACIPLAVAVAFLVSSLDDLKPAVVVFIVLGVSVALLTIVLRTNEVLGIGRYTTQGNVIAVAGLLLSQFWLVRGFRRVAVLVLICLVGVLITESRQSVAAFAVGLAATGVYWLVADRYRAPGRVLGTLRKMWALPAFVYTAVLLVVVVWAVVAWQQWIAVPDLVRNPVPCNCIAGRFVDVVTHPGGRNVMIEQGWTLFIGHPLVGAGLGSFVGLAPYKYPHNIVLELAGETGLVGVLLLLVPLAVGWVRLAAVGVKTASPAVASALMILLLYAVVANLSGDIASQRGLWVFGLVVLKLGWRKNPLEGVP